MRTALALLTSWAALAGCGGGPLGPGDSARGELTPEDAAVHPGQPTDVYVLDVGAGAGLVVRVESDDFAPFIILATPRAPMGVASDGGGGGGACVAVGPGVGPALTLYVSSAETGGRGRYRVTVEPPGGGCPPGGRRGPTVVEGPGGDRGPPA